jgi:hypothetical protein
MGSELITSGLSNLLPVLAEKSTQAVANAATPLITDTVAKSIAPSATQGVYNLLGSSTPKIQQSATGLSEALSQLRDSYEGYRMFKNDNIGKYDRFGDELNHRDPLAVAQTGYDYYIKQALGDAYEPTMEKIKGYAAVGNPNYDAAKNDLIAFLQSQDSDSVVNASHRLIPSGTQVWRAPNSANGISYSITKEGAQGAFNGAGGDVIPYTVKDTDRIIAPEFMERGNTGAPQGEVVIVPKTQEANESEFMRQANRLRQMQASRQLSSDGIKRVGSAEVAAVNPETLPGGWKELEKYLDTAQDRLPNAIGKPPSKITKGDIVKYLEDVGYDTEGTKDELWKSALMAIDDAAVDELYEAGGAAGEFLQDRLPFRQNPRLTDATNYYIGTKGRTGRLDAEYSDRLGIGRSNTPMSDRLVNPYGGAMGDYARGAFGTDPTWATGESGVSTAAHERLHAMQNIDKFDWDEEVVDAIDELRAELKNFYHDEKRIKAYHGNSKTDYYISGDEQEARMLQSYLDNEGYTNTYRKNSEKGTEWGDEIKPAFDKFFKKLRALSKKGIALPSLALLFGGAAVASKEKN